MQPLSLIHREDIERNTNNKLRITNYDFANVDLWIFFLINH
jgi:hypothetical protein